MQDWQETYIRNVREVAEIRQLFSVEEPDFDAWYAQYRAREARLQVLKAENTALLSTRFFPLLDELHSASPETIADLEAFGDVLMDWKTNLDCGVYVAIHDALLSLCRVRRDRDGIIRELYKLGMGLFYLQRPLVGVYCRQADSMHFRNEMVFTEAGSYFRYFDRIENSDTRAYILRGWANISICSPRLQAPGHHRDQFHPDGPLAGIPGESAGTPLGYLPLPGAPAAELRPLAAQQRRDHPGRDRRGHGRLL